MTKKLKQFKSVKSLLIICCFFLFTSSALASHFRYGDISYRVDTNDPTGRTVIFKVNSGWRSTWTSSLNIQLRFQPTGGGKAELIGKIPENLTGSSNGVNYYTGEISYTFKTNGEYKVYYDSCCKISTLENNKDSLWYVYTKVNVGSGNSSPVTSLPAVQYVQQNTIAKFNIPAVDPDGNALTYRLATNADGFEGNQPLNFLVSSNGEATFNTAGKTIGKLYNAAVVITDSDGAEILVDFILEITKQSTPPQWDYSQGKTPANDTAYQISPGQTITFPVEAFDTDSGSSVSISASGMPSNSTVSPAFGTTSNPINHQFSWTPNADQFGQFLINFTAKDNNNVTVSSSVSINISLKPVFDVPPTPVSGVHNTIVSPGELIQYTVQASDPDPTDLVRIIAMQGKDMSGNLVSVYTGASLNPIPTASNNPTSGTFSWTPTQDQWGHRHVIFTAEDSYGDQATHEVSQLVNTPPVFASTPVLTADVGVPYSYTIKVTDPDLPYGDSLMIFGTNLPSWLSVTDNADGTATLSGTPTPSDAGINAVKIVSEDLHHHMDARGVINQLFNITVNNCSVNAIAMDAVIELDVNGQASITINTINNGSTASCGIDTIVLDKTDFDCNNLGNTNTVTLTVTDSNGNIGTATANITVLDIIAPVISPPADISVIATSTAGALVNYTTPVATDNCTVITALTAGFADGATFPIGTTVVTHTATDGAGLLASASFNVIVSGLAPNITVPANITVNNDLGVCGAIVNYAATETTAIPASVITYDIQPGTTFGVGTTTVTATATNTLGTSSSTFDVIVEDSEQPTAITKNITVQLDASGNASITPNMIDNGSSDNCNVNTMTLDNTDFDCENIAGSSSNNFALNYNGNDNVVIQDNQDLRITGDMSLEAWFKMDTNPGDWVRVVGKGALGPRNYGLWYHPNGEFLFQQHGSGVSVRLNQTVNQGQWYHFAATKEGALTKLFIDGVLVATTNGGINPATSADPLTIGYAGYHAYHRGQIDEVRLWNVARTDQEIFNNYNIGLSGTENGLVAYYNMEEGQGTYLTDVSGNDHVGAIQGSTWTSSSVDLAGGISGGSGNKVTLTITDTAGNSSSATAFVTVEDNIAPSITLNGTDNVNHAAFTVYTDLGATAADNCSATLVTTDNLNVNIPGDYTVTYTATDSSNNVTIKSRTVYIVDTNNFPTAQNDTGIVMKNSEDNLFTVVTNDSYGTDGPNATHPISLTGFYTDLGGKLELVGDVVKYTPKKGYVGIDSFKYIITDLNGDAANAEVIITVEEISTPTALADTVDVIQDSASNPIDVLFNDSFGSNGPAGSNSITVPGITAESGVLVVNDNKVDYTPASGFSGTDTFSYTITDGSGDTASATVTIIVAPTVLIDGLLMAKSDAVTVAQNSTANYIDILADNGSGADDFGIDGAIDNGLTMTDGTLTGLSEQGIIIVDTNSTDSPLDDVIVYTPNTGFVGVDHFYYMITDANGATSIAQVTITVTEIDTPTAQNDTVGVTQDSTATTIDVLANDSFGSDGQATINALTINNATNTNGATIAVNDAKVNYTPATGFSGTDIFTYSITDGNGDASTANVTVTVGSYSLPTAKDDSVTFIQDSVDNVIFILDDNGSGADSYGSDGANASHPISLVAFYTDKGAALELDGTTVKYTPMAGYVGIDTFSYLITDLNGDADKATVTVTVIEIDTPTANDDTATVAQDSGITSIDVLANDSFGFDGAANANALTINTNTNGATINVNAAKVDYTPASGYSGTDSFTYTITDGNGDTATATVTVIVSSDNTNGLPIAQDDIVSVILNSSENVIYILDDNGSGVDSYGTDGPNATHPISLSGTYTDLGGKLELDGNTVLYTPADGFSGVDKFNYILTDATGDASTAQVTINVTSSKSSGIVTTDAVIKDLQVYPNPSKGAFKVLVYSEKAEQASVLLFDVTGKVVYNKKQLLSAGNNTMNLHVNVQTGILFLKVYTDNTNFGTKKILFK